MSRRVEVALEHFNQAFLLRERGMHEDAIAHCQEAIALTPDDALVHSQLGRILGELGRIPDALAAFEKAVALSPRCPAHYLNLVHCDRVAPGDRHIAAMEALAQEQDGFTEQERVDLAFALGKAYADTGQDARAFDHLMQGNARKRRMLVYDEAGTLGQLARIAQVFDAKRLRQGRRFGNPSYLPIFIVGMPRSGTSLLEQIIASHPQVFGAGELMLFQTLIMALREEAPGSPLFPEMMLDLPRCKLRELGDRYLAALKMRAAGTKRITDKMPLNFVYAGLIHLALPNARIIHVRRDPVDTCLSCFSIQFTGGGGEFCYDLGELGRFYHAYAELMAHWRRVLPLGVMMDVQYEGLVANPEREARRILQHCGLAWDERCLAYAETTRPVRTASAAQVRRPIYSTSVGRWRPASALLQPLLDGLGCKQS